MFHKLKESYKADAMAACLTAMLGLIIITPICGLLFQCQCDWPWLSFYSDCNYFHSEAIHKCPWCTSDIAGLGSIGMAFFLALASLFFTRNRFAAKAIVVQVTFGLTIFILIAVLSGTLAAYSQHYPFGVGNFYTKRS